MPGSETALLPNIPARKVPRSIYEGARAIGKTDAYQTSLLSGKKLEMLFGRLNRILNHNRLLLRGPCSACDEFHLAATVQNLRKRRRSPSRSAGTRLFSTIGPEPLISSRGGQRNLSPKALHSIRIYCRLRYGGGGGATL